MPGPVEPFQGYVFLICIMEIGLRIVCINRKHVKIPSIVWPFDPLTYQYKINCVQSTLRKKMTL